MSSQPFMLSNSWRKTLKALHLIFAGINLGGMLCIAGLFAIKTYRPGLFSDIATDFSIYFINNYIIFFTVIGNLMTSLIFALFTHWGFFKATWLTVKWVLFVLLAVVFLVWFIPTVNEMTSLTSSGLSRTVTGGDYDSLTQKGLWLSVTIFAIFGLIFFISSLKPWPKRKSDVFQNLVKVRWVVIVILILFAAFGIFNAFQLSKLRNMEIEEIDLAQIEDGLYEGQFDGGGGIYKVKVKIENHSIVTIEHETTRTSKWARFADPTILKIIEKQSPDVDAITGATTTSKCIMKAVENALQIEN